MSKDIEDVRPVEEREAAPDVSTNTGINSFLSELYSCKDLSKESATKNSGNGENTNKSDDAKGNNKNGESKSDKGISLSEIKLTDPFEAMRRELERHSSGEKVKVDDNMKDLSPAEIAERMTKNGEMDEQTKNTLARAERDGKLQETVKAINKELEKSGSPYHLETKTSSHEWERPGKSYIQPYPPPRHEPDGRTTEVSVEMHKRENVVDKAQVSEKVENYADRKPFYNLNR